MRRHLLLVILATLLFGCGSASDVTQTPEAIHARWIAAMRANDRAAALALVDPGMPRRELFVDQALRTMHDLMTTPSSPSGPLHAAGSASLRWTGRHGASWIAWSRRQA
jgi:hypothetical protein